MAMKKHLIFGVHITDRVEHVSVVQNLLTQYGESIKTRLGLHEANEGFSSPNGLLLLEMIGEHTQCDELADKLNAVEGVEVQRMLFDHP